MNEPTKLPTPEPVDGFIDRDGTVWSVPYGTHERGARLIVNHLVQPVNRMHSCLDELMDRGWCHVYDGRIDVPFVALSEAQLDAIESAMHTARAIVREDAMHARLTVMRAYTYADGAARIMAEYSRD